MSTALEGSLNSHCLQVCSSNHFDCFNEVLDSLHVNLLKDRRIKSLILLSLIDSLSGQAIDFAFEY